MSDRSIDLKPFFDPLTNTGAPEESVPTYDTINPEKPTEDNQPGFNWNEGLEPEYTTRESFDSDLNNNIKGRIINHDSEIPFVLITPHLAPGWETVQDRMEKFARKHTP